MEQAKTIKNFVPKGIAHFKTDLATEPQLISFLLLPNMSMLAFSAAIEPLRIANQLTGQTLFQWETLTDDGKPISCSNNIELKADREIGPTGPGAIIFAVGGLEPHKAVSKKSADWLRLQWRKGRTVGGLCTGAYALAKAGILQDKKFTLHWENLLDFRETYADLDPLEQLYSIDGRILTSGGGSAATDLLLKLIGSKYGDFLAQEVLNMCLHPAIRPANEGQKSSLASSLRSRNKTLLSVINLFLENIEDNVDLDAMLKEISVSRRQVERLFHRHLGQSPKQYLIDMRLGRGRSLLAGTNMSVIEIATACGFSSASHFSKRFKEKFGQSPHQFSAAVA